MLLFTPSSKTCNSNRHAGTKSLALGSMLALVAVVAPQVRAGGKNRDAAFAQKLVDDTAAKHKPELIYLGLHGVTPHSKQSVIFASTKPDKIGKKSSCADLHVVEKGIPVMEMKGKTTTVLERLLDSKGRTIGLIVVGFDLGEGEESQAAKLSKELGEELAKQISSKDQLFGK